MFSSFFKKLYTLPGTETSNRTWKWMKTSFLLGWPIFRCHVSFGDAIATKYPTWFLGKSNSLTVSRILCQTQTPTMFELGYHIFGGNLDVCTAYHNICACKLYLLQKKCMYTLSPIVTIIAKIFPWLQTNIPTNLTACIPNITQLSRVSQPRFFWSTQFLVKLVWNGGENSGWPMPSQMIQELHLPTIDFQGTC